MNQGKNRKQPDKTARSTKPRNATLAKSAGGLIADPNLRNTYISLIIIVVVSFIAYMPALHNGFVFDDEFYIVNNKMIQSINLKEIFSKYVMGNYHPLTMLSYSIEYHFWGLNEMRYHAVNILLHLSNVILVFYVVFLLSNKHEVALVASLLFGIHPMHVESVAWVAERKDLLYTFFFLASYVCYLIYLKDGKRKFYFFCLLLFLLSLLSKAMAASLPVVLILTDYFKEGRISIKSLLQKTPFFALSIVFGVVAIYAQQSHHAVVGTAGYAVWPRIVFGCYGFMEYLIKLLVPLNLSAYYPYPIRGGNIVPPFYYIYPFLLLVLIAFIIYSLRWSRKIVFGMGFFTITVFLVLQLLPVGDAIIADRYSYIPSLGFFYLAGEGFYWLWNNKSTAGKLRIPAATLLIAIAAFLSVETRARCAVWKNGLSLWNDVISQYQTITAAYINRGKFLLDEKKYDEALSDFNKIIELDPTYPLVYNNRGALLMDLNKYEEANRDFDKAIELQPQYPFAYNNRGMLLVKMGKYEKALSDYNKAIEQKPDFTDAYFNRGIVLEMLKRHEKALRDYNKVIELDPNYVLVYNNRGNILMNQNRYDEALHDYNKAIALDPRSANAYLNKGTLFTYQKKYEDAIATYSKAIEVDPDFGQAYYNRAIVENTTGKKDASCVDLWQAIALKYSPAQDAYNLYCH